MGQLRTRNANRWATYFSSFPIVGGSIGRAIQQNALSKNQGEEAAGINPVDVSYTESPYAKQQLDIANNAYNARMGGAAQAQNNISQNQGNSFFNLARAATSPQALMAAAGGLQYNTNNSLNQLAQQESSYKSSMLSNLNNALSSMTDENAKVYADGLRKYNRDFDLKQGLLNSSQQNAANATQSLSNVTTGLVNTALSLLPGIGGLTPKIKTTEPAQLRGNNFNPTAGWFTPRLNTYNPTIYGRQ